MKIRIRKNKDKFTGVGGRQKYKSKSLNQEDAERVLEELRNKEKNLQAKVKKQPAGKAGKPNQANQKGLVKELL